MSKITAFPNTTPVRARVISEGVVEVHVYGDLGYDIRAIDVLDEIAAAGSVETVHVRINSYGGDAFEGLALHARLRQHGARIIVHVDGVAMSAASVVAMSGDEVVIADGGLLMIHEAWAGVSGPAADLRSMANRLEAVSARMAAIYERRTGASAEQIRAWMAAETTFTAAEAVEFGFADRVADEMAIAAKFFEERHKFKKRPAADLIAPPEPSKATARRALQHAGLSRRAADRLVVAGWPAIDPAARRRDVLQTCKSRLASIKPKSKDN